MKVIYNFVLALELVLFGGGIIAAVPLYFTHGLAVSFLSLIVGLLALANNKLDVVSLAQPKRG